MAGSFTLDSFGDAYIDSIEGAPERHHRFEPTVGAQVDVGFGIDWSDLWNMTSGESVPASVVVSKALSSRGGECASVWRWLGRLRVRTQTWGYKWCGRCAVGASRPKDWTSDTYSDAAPDSVECRGWHVGHSDGVITDKEGSIESVLRESVEETNITPEDIEVVGSYCEDHGPWSYTTVFAFEKPGHAVHPKANDDESMEIVWVPIDEVADRKPLTAMRTDWPSFERRLRALTVEHKGE